MQMKSTEMHDGGAQKRPHPRAIAFGEHLRPDGGRDEHEAYQGGRGGAHQHIKIMPRVDELEKHVQLSTRRSRRLVGSSGLIDQLHPVVAPQVSHLRQVPLRSKVKLPHSSQASPS